MPILK